MSDLHFDAASHAYLWRGKAVPSVTQVLKETGLIDDQWYTERSRLIGQAVHLATEYHDRGVLRPDSVSDIVRPYLAAWTRFREECGMEPTEVEMRIYHQSAQYAGTLDRVMKTGSDTYRWLIDIKTGAPQPWHAWQVAAYAMALPDPRIYRRARVQLSADGKYKLTEFPVSDLTADYQVFHCARFTHNHQKRRF